MAFVLSHPFRFQPGGGPAATVQEGSDQYKAEQIAIMLMTHPGERPLVPDFGVADPTFVGVEEAALATAIAEYGPPLTIQSVTITTLDATSENVVVAFV